MREPHQYNRERIWGSINIPYEDVYKRQGLVNPKEPVTTVRIYNTNTDKVIEAQVQVENGRVQYDGDFAIAGVPGTAAPIKLSFLDPMGSVTGKLLPTGNASDMLDIPGFGQVEAVSYTHLDVYKRQHVDIVRLSLSTFLINKRIYRVVLRFCFDETVHDLK